MCIRDRYQRRVRGALASMSTVDLYNVGKARFWDEIMAKEQLQNKKAVYAVNAIRRQGHLVGTGVALPDRPQPAPPADGPAKEGPEYDDLRPGWRQELYKSAKAMRSSKLGDAIPKVSGERYKALKDKYRPQTGDTGQPGKESVDTGVDFGIDPRFSSQVGYQLFGFADWNRAPVTDLKKSNEFYGRYGALKDALRSHDRNEFNPAQKFTRPVLGSHDVGWRGFDQGYYTNRLKNKELIHPRKSSHMTKFASHMIASGRRDGLCGRC
eukprot:TRINITY_DN7218_c0_g2_i1.p1 TRINITY_DN7218_c0_g2~~TRINITY_DN7218_c0_g2_i1.p1  ORF type:complete len:267 (+),score=65.47 TRINITY_DN7218_c0_g2_i1:73-873(+)